ncbi:hypothetical protein H6F78_04930 [Coleofasciculus sp. FACHB-64]|uniref:hypothetical protein n=1 Tax=Cyanophyceae TaxID=3028117 RepID=UPI001682E1FA|nr:MULTISPECIES: hypothetical protein [unclassified Coleofasciculus]MBD1840285.1 hypothetical protein [Coleofasciculus sp. FACHB-501]MBD1880675.1 hypothetical protein [Coleofasciculus sp. FACHB-T130]MBD1893834.1 hypothetical protein [Coleofasciculus sp. FACHB-129]MBD2044980.1 hypothetical protein [Coleofasciculus sp. FACHB-64]
MNRIDGESKSQMIPLWNKSFSAFCLSLLVMFAGNIVLIGCGEAAKNSEPVQESEKESNQGNQADDDDNEGQETTGSSDQNDDEEKDGQEEKDGEDKD